jgi:gamma-glutamylaminecyclotransferase
MERTTMKTLIYFAYGSNLNPAQMRRRCPSAVQLARATLANHRLSFAGHSASWSGGVANVVRANGAKVEGLLYVLSERDVQELDRCEGVPAVYDRVVKRVVDEHGRQRRVHVYRLDPELADEAMPGMRYFEVICAAYKRNGFDRAPLADALARASKVGRARVDRLAARPMLSPPTGPTLARVFVYGTLRAGERNHRLLEGAEFVGQARTAPCFRMVDLGSFPAIVGDGSTPIEGEVYDVDDAMLARLDELEGHPRFYTRTRIELDDGSEALAYLLRPTQVVGRPPIPSGNWLARN